MTTPTGSELAAALAKVQAALPHVNENKVGKIEGVSKSTGKPFSYEYKYADLTAVAEAIMPLLGQNGLAFTARPTLIDGRFVLAYSLLHSSGEREDGEYPLPDRGTPQELGKHISYGRRYCLTAVTGVAPGGEDNDAADATEVHMDRARTTARPPSDVPSRPVTRGPRPGSELEQLRHGTVEATPDDRLADRVRGPVPPDENLWQAEPPEEQPGSYDPKDVTAIQIAYGKLQFDTRTDRLQLLKISGQLVGRTIASHKDLSHVEAKQLRATLEGLKGDRGLLMEQLTGIRQAAAAVGAQDTAEDTQEPPS